MAKIVGINSINYIDKKKLESKISFKEGEKFSAKVCDVDKSTGQVTLKLSNGWEFKGHLKESEDSLEFMEGKFLKFEVKDFSQGKLELGIVKEDINKEFQSSLKKILSSFNLEDSKENVTLLENMLKHDIPLTKDNIYMMKNILELKNKVLQNEEVEDKFINLFLEKGNINKSDEEIEFIRNNLKDFFHVLKNTEDEVILSLKENDIDITSKENINSLKEINKEYGVIIRDLEKIINTLKNKEQINLLKNTEINSNVLEDNDSKFINKKIDIDSNKNTSDNKIVINNKEIMNNKENHSKVVETYVSKEFEGTLEEDVQRLLKELNLESVDYDNHKEVLKNNKNSETSEINSNSNSNNNSSIDGNDIDKVINTNEKSLDVKEQQKESNVKDYTIKSNEQENKDVEKKFTSTRLNELSNIIDGDEGIKDQIIKKLNLEKEFNLKDGKLNEFNALDIEELDLSKEVKKLLINSLKVKGEIGEKINELKSLIKEVIKLDNKFEGISEKVLLQELKSPLNNIKVLNSLTNQYYYLDTPLNLMDKEYPFKFIIKNNNKDKKAFDSKCIKIFASVKTINMGVIDSYINVNNKNMEVKISSPKKFMNIINKNKDILVQSLSIIGYFPNITIDERCEDVNISNASKFFQDKSFTVIDTLV